MREDVKKIIEKEKDHDIFVINSFVCEIKRYPLHLSLNGYIYIPSGHPWHGKHYDDLIGVDVHGGLTYSEPDNITDFLGIRF